MSSRIEAARTVRLFDLDVHAETLEETASRCIALAGAARGNPERRPALVFSINPEKAVKSTRDPAVRTLLQRATLLIPDGIGVCVAARLLARTPLRRVPGSDLMPLLCSLADKAGLSVYVYGATPESNAGAIAAMRQRWPSLRIAGASDGYRPAGTADDAARGTPDTVAGDIARVKPDIVFVGLGSPRQEVWMAEVAHALPAGLMQGVGGTIDVISGTVPRASRAWQRLGLEWLYRLLQNPSRWRRQLALVDFVVLVARRFIDNVVPMRHQS